MERLFRFNEHAFNEHEFNEHEFNERALVVDLVKDPCAYLYVLPQKINETCGGLNVFRT